MKTTKQPKCSICRQVPRTDCDWKQGRCPHTPSMFDQIMSDQHKARFFNLLKFFTKK